MVIGLCAALVGALAKERMDASVGSTILLAKADGSTDGERAWCVGKIECIGDWRV